MTAMAVLSCTALALVLWWALQGWWADRRRANWRAQPFPAAWRRILRRRVPLIARLPPPLQRRLKGQVQALLAEVPVIGCRGLEVTDEMRRAFGLDVTILPMSDDPVRTVVHIESGPIPFQEYFVRLQHAVPVTKVEYSGASSATFIDRSIIERADTIVIAPSNPIVSIGPIRAIPGVEDALRARRPDVVAVSPIVAGSALKGPADRMLTELGHEPTVVGVARLYAPICGTLVIDEQDAHLASAVEAEGLACVVTDTIMSRDGVGASLARASVRATPRQGGLTWHD